MTTLLTASEWQQLEELFHACDTMQSEERDAYLAGQSLSEEMRRQLTDLLASSTETGVVTDAVAGGAAELLEADLPSIGGHLGPYRIIGVIGRGGMGIVYKAVRADDAYQKTVAIKASRFAALSTEQRKRFLDERQILAVLDHPNIARMLDGGTTAQGIPYVVMEYVAGTAIDRYCEQHALDDQARIAMMVQVCRTVGYAHRYLVVHRDLKPDNVLVSDDGVPKLLDFGIAKVLDPAVFGLQPGTNTEASQPMTPNFAAPEQLSGEPVTTSTDVYQLGLMLYVLLTGKHPFPLPSRSGVAQVRAKPPKQPALSADLDKIVQQAMHEDPSRRYASAIELAEDLERYRNGFPVTARTASMTYQARKFVLRHKLASGLAALAALLVIGFAIMLAVQARRLARERDTAERVASFLTTVFSAGNPAQARGSPMSARQLLDQGAAAIDHDTSLDQAVKARLLSTLAAAYRSQAVFERSWQLYAECLQIQKSLYGPQSREAMDTTNALMNVDFDLEDYDRGSTEAAEWIRLARIHYGNDDAKISQTLGVLATTAFLHGKLKLAETDIRQAVAMDDARHESTSIDGIVHQAMLGNVLYYEGRFKEEELVYRHALGEMEVPDWENSSGVVDVMNMQTKLGTALNREGRWREAADLLQPLLALRRKVEGEEHSQTASTEMELGVSLSHLGRTQEADSLMQLALTTEATLVGPTAMDYGAYEGKLAEVYLTRNQPALAEPLLLDKIAICRKNLGPESLVLARTLLDLGAAELAEDHLDRAGESLSAALAMETKLNGDNSSYAAADHAAIGKWLAEKQDWTGAESELQKAVNLYRASGSSDLPAAISAAEELKTMELGKHSDRR